MTDLRTAAQQALETLEGLYLPLKSVNAAITALRAALAQEQAEPAQEPVPQPGVWMHPWPPVRVPKAKPAQEQAEPVAWLQPKTMDAHLRPDLGYETCSSADYGAFPVYRVPPKAEPTQEPVAWVEHEWSGTGSRKLHFEKRDPTVRDEVVNPVWTPLYTDPPQRQPLTERVDLSRCPKCGGIADNGHDRSIPPNPYLCTKCMAEPVQEPVAWLYEAGTDRTLHWQKPPLYGTPLYTAPPQRQPLSGLEVERLLEQVIGSLPAARNLVRAVERAHGIIGSEIRGDSHQTLDDAMHLPRAMAQAYESGYKAGVANEREACATACESRFMGDLTREDIEARRCAAAIRARGEQL